MKRTQEARTMCVAVGLAACVALATSMAQSNAAVVVADTTAPRVAMSAGGCARTPAAAVEAAAVQGLAGTVLPSVAQGYRVKAVRWDPLQRQSWAVVQSCEHPELPSIALLTKLPGPFAISSGEIAAGQPLPIVGETISAAVIRANTAVSVVKTGDVVRLWRADERAHIELMGTAEENGAVGARVRVRLATPKDADGQTAPPQFLAGVVRGPADVEIER